MARLSAHGHELVRLEYPTLRIAYMADGQVLRDCGDGWKLWKRIKAGVNVSEAAKNAKARYEAMLDARPFYARFLRLMVECGSLKFRSRIGMCLDLMPEDPDGIWSEMDDSYEFRSNITVDECADLCRAFKAANYEMRESKSVANIAA